MKYKIIISAILILFITTGFAMAPLKIMKSITNIHIPFETYSSEDFGISSTKINLKTKDNLSLVAWEVEAKKPKGIVIFVSGIHSPTVTAFFGHAKMLKDNNYSSVLVEMRAHGDSEGSKIALGMTEYLDVKAAVDYIKSKELYAKLPIIIFGTSMGAATAINSIGEIKEIDGVISLSSYSTWADTFCDNMIIIGVPKILSELEKPFVWLYLGFEYGFDKLRINPMAELRKLNGRPALLMHSRGDSQVPYASFERLTKKAGKNVQTFIREGNYHFICYYEYFSKPWEDTEYSNAILNFLSNNFE
jgi:alpha-beta hydrolase superfamily lysophospholipase